MRLVFFDAYAEIKLNWDCAFQQSEQIHHGCAVEYMGT